jgi:hypothetical protein
METFMRNPIRGTIWLPMDVDLSCVDFEPPPVIEQTGHVAQARPSTPGTSRRRRAIATNAPVRRVGRSGRSGSARGEQNRPGFGK